MALIGWWPLDGNTNDYSVNANHGVDVNSNVTFVNGKIGQAAYFDSQTDGINILNVDLTGKSSVTFAVWINPSTISLTYSRWLGGQRLGSNHNPDLSVSPSGALSYYFLGNNTTWVITNVTIPFNAWTHLVYTFKTNGEVIIYKNGVLSYTATHNPFTLTQYNYMLGTRYDFNNERIVGSLNDFRIYDHVLSQKEINELAKAKVLHYTFNKDENLVYDNSGYKYNGTIVGTKTFNGNGTVSFPNNSYLNTNKFINPEEFTISIDYKRDTTVIWDILWSTEVWSSGLGYFGYFDTTNGRLAFQVASSLALFVQASNFVDVTQLNNYVFTKDSAGLAKIYINGILRGSGQIGNVSITKPIRFNSRYNNDGTSFADARPGTIGTIEVYSTVLSDAQVLDKYQVKAKIDNQGNLYANEFVEDYVVEDDEVAPGITLKKLFEESNLIPTNSDFSNGTTNWSSTFSSTISNEDGKLKITGSNNNAGVIRCDVPLISGNIYYFLTGYVSSTVNFYMENSNPYSTLSFPSTASFASKMHTANTTSNHCIYPYRSSGGDTPFTAYIDNINFINLTALFGAGNEPTKAQMDAWYLRYTGQTPTLTLSRLFEDNNLMSGVGPSYIRVTNNSYINGKLTFEANAENGEHYVDFNLASKGITAGDFVYTFTNVLENNAKHYYVMWYNNGTGFNSVAQGSATFGIGLKTFLAQAHPNYVSGNALFFRQQVLRLNDNAFIYPGTGERIVVNQMGAINFTKLLNDGYFTEIPSKEQIDIWYRDYSQSRIKQNGQVITQEFNEVGIDTIAYENKTYKEIFETNNMIDFSNQYSLFTSANPGAITTKNNEFIRIDKNTSNDHRMIYNVTKTVNGGNQVYYRMTHEGDGQNLDSFYVYFPGITSAFGFVSLSSFINSKFSTIITHQSSGTGLYNFGRAVVTNPTAQGNYTKLIGEIFAINLSTTFTVPPTKAQMDTLYERYRELKMVEQKMKIAKNSINILGSLNEGGQ